MASAPPLRIWLYSAALVAGVLALQGWSYCKSSREPRKAIAMHTQQFLDARPAQDSLRVLALGSSLLWAGTPPGGMPAIPGVTWMRMTKPGIGLGYLAPSLEEIEHSPPDVLVIEENLLARAQSNAAMDEMRIDFFLASKKLAYRLIGQEWIPTAQQYLALLDQNASFQCNEIAPQILAREISKHGAEIQQLFSYATVDQELANQLQRLSRRGVQIIIMELRRSQTIEQTIAPEKKNWQQRLLQALPPSPHIRYVASPAYTQANLHCDGSHMNQRGARLFSAWWQAQLRQLRKEI